MYAYDTSSTVVISVFALADCTLQFTDLINFFQVLIILHIFTKMLHFQSSVNLNLSSLNYGFVLSTASWPQVV